MNRHTGVPRSWPGRTALALLAACMMPAAAASQVRDLPAGLSPLAIAHRDSVVDVAVARARNEGDTSISVVVATRHAGRASTDSLIEALIARGGSIQFQAADIGYVRAAVPVDAVASLRSVPALGDYIIDPPIGWNVPAQWSAVHRPTWSGRVLANGTSDRPLLSPDVFDTANPYLPLDEIGADRLARELPLADGRGVTIGIVEGSIDYTHPALQTARTLKGDVVPKIAGVIDPTWFMSAGDAVGRGERSRLDSDTIVNSRTGVVDYRGARLQLPAPGQWRIGAWIRTGRPVKGEPAPAVPFLVAWRDTMEAWLDLNHNNDFRDDLPIANLNARFHAGRFPPDSAAGRRANSFAVAFDPDGHPHVYTVSHDGSSHTTMVAGVAAGAGFFGGSLGGVAPGAQLVLVIMPGASVSGFIESVLAAARDQRIDVITHQSAGFASFPHAAAAFPGLVLERIATHYDKPIFVGAGNAGRFGSVGMSSAPPSIVSVGAFISRRSYRVNQGIETLDADNVASYSSRGPMPDGTRKPDLLAPTQMVTTASCADTGAPDGMPVYPGAPPSVIYRLPPCYMLGSGTSTAAPFAAGTAALLISAARLSELPEAATKGRAIRWALLGSARPLPALELHRQGAGLVQVDSAWSLLRKTWPATASPSAADGSPDSPMHDVAIRAPVRNAYTAYLADGIGGGLYVEARAGSRDKSVVTLERQNGRPEPVRYVLRWRENDGTFAADVETLSLPLGIPVPIEITMTPEIEGLHEAALELVDPARGTVAHRVPVAVMAPFVLDARNGFMAEWSGETTPPRSRLLPVRVPPGTKTLRIVLHAERGEPQVHWHGPLAAGPSTMIPLTANPVNPTATLTLDDPFPGVWTLEISAPVLGSPGGAAYHLTVSVALATDH